MSQAPGSNKPNTLRDTTQVDFNEPLQIAYVGPSITPLTGFNAGYRVYQVDAKTFSVMGAQTYFANISNSLTWTKPVWEFEYDTRHTYSVDEDKTESTRDGDAEDDEVEAATAPDRVAWPSNAPLNATFWHRVTDKMLSSSSSTPSLLDLYNTYESKSSISPIQRGSGGAMTPEQKICFLRSGSWFLGHQCRTSFNVSSQSTLHPRSDMAPFGLVWGLE